jgi:hypothetical protein
MKQYDGHVLLVEEPFVFTEAIVLLVEKFLRRVLNKGDYASKIS